jgi:branched-subunit amino acid aminotransferase/4-amino-4-deoxychorismate lyase
MIRYVHLNGALAPQAEANISVFDPAETFADFLYESFGALECNIADFVGHHDRLLRSLAETDFGWEVLHDNLYHLLRDVARANEVDEGCI